MDYPNYILKPIKENDLRQGFSFRPAMAFLMSELADVDLKMVEDCTIYSRSVGRYVPWYSAKKGGGAITLGNRKKQSITFTENFFSADKEVYAYVAYGDELNAWLRMAAHEVGHLKHAQRFKFLLIYLIIFLFQYARFGHDEAPLEKEANYGSDNYYRLRSYLRSERQPQLLDEIFRSPMSDQLKIEKLKLTLSKFRTKLDEGKTKV